MKKVKIEIEVSTAMIGICKALGTKPAEFFQKVERDLIGDSKQFSEDDRMLLHLYLAQSIANENNIERSKVEDFLSHLVSLKNHYEAENYTFLVNDLFVEHEVFCNYCKELELKK